MLYIVFDSLKKVWRVIAIDSTKSISISPNMKNPKYVDRKLLLARAANEGTKESA